MWTYTVHPEKFVGDYLLSRKVGAVRKYGPVIEGPQILVEGERTTLRDTEIGLVERRELYKQQRKALDEQWKSLFEEGRHLKANFNTFNKFVMANSEKRTRAQENYELQKRMILEKEEGIARYKGKIQQVQMIIADMNEKVNEHRMYEKYMNNVIGIVDPEDQMKNPFNFVERFEYYIELGVGFANKQAEVFEVLQNAKSELSKYRDVQKNTIMGLHTTAATLQGRYEETSRRTRRLEILISKIRDKAHEKYMDVRVALVSIWNLYVLMCRKKNIVPTAKKQDYENQLLFISRTLRQWQQLNEDLQQLMRKTKKRVSKK